MTEVPVTAAGAPVPVIVVFRAKAGMADRLDAIVRRHQPMLHDAGLATATAPTLLRAADGSVIEIFEWVSEAAMRRSAALWRSGAAPASPQEAALPDLWRELELVADYVPLADLAEAQGPFARFALHDKARPVMPVR